MLVNVKVKTNSDRQEIVKGFNDCFLAFLKSSPENNRANVELIKLLHRYFNRPVRIKYGFKRRIKVVEVLGVD